MRANDFYSMTAFDNAVDFLMPEIKVINEVSCIPRPERIKMIAYKYFMLDQSTITPKQIEALDVVRQVGLLLKSSGSFTFGSKDYGSND